MTMGSPDKRNNQNVATNPKKTANAGIIGSPAVAAYEQSPGVAQNTDAMQMAANLGALGANNNTRAGQMRTQDNSLCTEDMNTPLVKLKPNQGEGI